MNDVTPARAALSRALEFIIKERGLTNKQVADWAGISERSVGDMRNAAHDPYLSQVDKVAKALGYQAWQLLSLQDDSGALELIRVFNTTDAHGRELIRLAVGAAKNR